MSTYVIADIHGCYKTFIKLLEKVEFDDKKDVLYIAGDIMDRGAGFVDLYNWVCKRHKKSAFMTLGNHEYGLIKDLMGEDVQHCNATDYYGSLRYMRKQIKLKDSQIKKMATFFSRLPIYYDITVNERRFVIVHANITSDLRNVDEYDSIWNRELARKKDGRVP